MASEKISQLDTLANPPLAPVFDAVITNDGTTATNFQRPQGVIVQPTQTNANGVNVYFQGSDITNAGTGSYSAGQFQGAGGAARLTNAAGQVQGGLVGATGGLATYGTASGYAANFVMQGGLVNGVGTVAGGNAYLQAGNAVGGTYNAGGAVNVSAGYGLQRGGQGVLAAGGGYTHGGNQIVQAGNASGTAGVAGNLVLEAGYGATNGSVIVQPVPTADPHVLNALWRDTLTNGVNISQG